MHAWPARKHGPPPAGVILLGTLMASSARAASLAVPRKGKRALLAGSRLAPIRPPSLQSQSHTPPLSAHRPYVRTWYSPMLTEDLRAGQSRSGSRRW